MIIVIFSFVLQSLFPQITASGELTEFLSKSVTDATLIMDGSSDQPSLLYENYAHGYKRDSKHYMWSISKTVLNALVGIAIKENKIKLDATICTYLTDAKGDEPYCKIKVQDLLDWSSGLLWREDYEKATDLVKSSVLQMLYGDGITDVQNFILKHELIYDPGRVWRYSSGDSSLLMAVLQNAYGVSKFDPWNKLFNVIGMDATWERDNKGIFIGSSNFYTSASGLANLGLLYLRNGQWGNVKLFPEDWVAYSTKVPDSWDSTVAGSKIIDRDWNDISGKHIWLNRSVNNIKKPWSCAPDDTYAARGHWGQYLFIIPSMNLVVVRLGNDRDSAAFDANNFLDLVIKLVGKTPVKGCTNDSHADVPKDPDQKTKYKTSMLTLGAKYVAKEFCSCHYVLRQTEKYCADYVKNESLNPSRDNDENTQTIRARTLLFWKGKAQFKDDRYGCSIAN